MKSALARARRFAPRPPHPAGRFASARPLPHSSVGARATDVQFTVDSPFFTDAGALGATFDAAQLAATALVPLTTNHHKQRSPCGIRRATCGRSGTAAVDRKSRLISAPRSAAGRQCVDRRCQRPAARRSLLIVITIGKRIRTRSGDRHGPIDRLAERDSEGPDRVKDRPGGAAAGAAALRAVLDPARTSEKLLSKRSTADSDQFSSDSRRCHPGDPRSGVVRDLLSTAVGSRSRIARWRELPG
jgi:hypothetical protein